MIVRPRALVASALERSGFVALLFRARHMLPARTLTVVNYHRVNLPEAVRDYDEGTLDATPESLDRAVGLLRRHFSLIDPNHLVDHLSGRPWPRHPALITFDDGYRDNREHALPILARHGAKAFFLVSTDFISRRRVFWWDRISYTLKHATRVRFTLEYPHHQEFDLATGIEPARERLLGVVKATRGLAIDRFLRELATAARVEWNDEEERRHADSLIMTWDDVRALRDAGMAIGSHTRTHRVLGTVPTSELSDELRGSRMELEKELGQAVQVLAYPVGVPVARLPHVRAAVADAGYRAAFSYRSGTHSLRRLDALDIRRHAVDLDWTLDHFRTGLLFPRLA
jgi:peptidoglycan/xylan/chitin deacetylase (PgdA/CDA1 family)